MVLIFAPVITEVNKIRRSGIRFIEIRKNIFFSLILILNLYFFKITKIIIKKGIKIKICLAKKMIGLIK